MERSEQGADPAATAGGPPVGERGEPPVPHPSWPPPRAVRPAPPPPPPPSWPPPEGWASSDRDRAAPAAPATAGASTEGSLGEQLEAGAPPVDRPSAWMWLFFAGLGFLAGQVLAAIVVALAAAVSGNASQLAAISRLSEPPTWYIVSTLLGLWAGFFGAGWLASRVRGTRHLAADLGLRFRWADLLGLPIGVGGQILVALIYVPIAPHVHDFNQRFDAPSQRLTGGSHGVDYLVIGVFTVVGAPFFEELFFRGVLLRSLARLFGNFGRFVGPALAIVVTGVLFGLAHDEGLQLLGLAVFGVILSFIAYRTGRLGMNMVAHASFNLTAVAAVVVPLTLGARAHF